MVPHGFAFICLTMACAGIWFMYSTAFIVRKITAIPKTSLPASYLKGGAGKARKKMSADEEQSLQALQASPIALECELSKMIPLLPAKKIIAAPSQVLLPFKFANTPVAMAAGQVVQPSPVDGFIGKIAKPFEFLGRGGSSAFQGLKRGLLREGFSPIKIKGLRYKVDVTGGKLYNKGKVIDHVVAYRPERFLNASWQDHLFRM